MEAAGGSEEVSTSNAMDLMSPTPKKVKKKSKKSKSSADDSSSTIGLGKEEKKKKKKKKKEDLDEDEDSKYGDDDDDTGSISLRSTRNHPETKPRKSKSDDASVRSRKAVDNDDASVRSSKSSRSKRSISSKTKSSSRGGDGDDDASVKSGKSTRSRRTTTTRKTKSSSRGGDGDDDASVRSGKSTRSRRTTTTSSKTKSSSRGGDGDDDASVRSGKSTRSKRTTTTTTSKTKSSSLDDGNVTPVPYSGHLSLNDEQENLMDLKADNEALVAETVALRRQLKEALAAGVPEMEQLRTELKRYQNEVVDLKTEVRDYKDMVKEKDSLITKLTEAVNAQLDKVENLELKLQRAEQEFCIMEDELKELEDENELLKSKQSFENSVNLDGGSSHTIHSKSSGSYAGEGEVDDHLDQEEDALSEEMDEEMDEIQMKEMQLKKREQELLEFEERLNVREAAQFEHEFGMHEKAFVKATRGIGRGRAQYDDEEEEEDVSKLKSKITKLESRITDLQRELAGEGGTSNVLVGLKERLQESQIKLAEIGEENRNILRAQEERFAQEKARDLEYEIQIQTIQDASNKKIHELHEENRSLQTQVTVLKEQNQSLKNAIPDEGIDPMDHAMAGLQDEIAGLREKIVEKELEVSMRNEEIARLAAEVEERDYEARELQVEFLSLETQLKETKATTTKKMSQKDETIAFMQNEMVRIMKEKSQIEQKLASKPRESKGAPPASTSIKQEPDKKDEDVERAKIQAFNDQIAKLDTANQKLQEELKQAQFQHGLQLKEREGRILQIEAEVADLNWEMKIRKEADYVSLLKDRKERKVELDKMKRDLKISDELVSDLKRQIENLKRNQKDLENDVEELNKSLVSRDSGDYVSGLKRQIRSLKEHNMTLERKIEIETANTKDILAKKDAKLVALKKEVRDLRYPGNAVVRGMLALATGGGVVDNITAESAHSLKRSSHDSPKGKDTKESQRLDRKAVSLPNPAASLWSAILSPFGPKRSSLPIELGDKIVGVTNSPDNSSEKISTTNDSGSKQSQEADHNTTVSAMDGSGEGEDKALPDGEAKVDVGDATGASQDSRAAKIELI